MFMGKVKAELLLAKSQTIRSFKTNRAKVYYTEVRKPLELSATVYCRKRASAHSKGIKLIDYTSTK